MSEYAAVSGKDPISKNATTRAFMRGARGGELVALGLQDEQSVVCVARLTARVDDFRQHAIGRGLIRDEHQLGLEFLPSHLGDPLLAAGVLFEDVDQRRGGVAGLVGQLYPRRGR